MSVPQFSIEGLALQAIKKILKDSEISDPVVVLYDAADPQGHFAGIDAAIKQGRSPAEISEIGRDRFQEAHIKLKPLLAVSASQREKFEAKYVFPVQDVYFVLSPFLIQALMGCELVLANGRFCFRSNTGVSIESLSSLAELGGTKLN